jgi:2'-5' RNA ligase
LKDAGQWRCFLAWELTAASLDRLSDSLDEHRVRRRQLRQIRWLPQESWHITQRFIGDADATLRDAITRGVEAAYSEERPAWTLRPQRVMRLAPFPKRRPSVLAVLMTAGADWMQLGDRIDARLQGQGLPDRGRRWLPHLSVARLKGRVADAPDVALDLSIELSGLGLFRSELAPDGARYTRLRHWPLQSISQGPSARVHSSS